MIDKNRSDHEHIMPLFRVEDNSAITNLSTKKENWERLKWAAVVIE